ncbi:MAG: extensin family protein [Paracoccaceae bacterium]
MRRGTMVAVFAMMAAAAGAEGIATSPVPQPNPSYAAVSAAPDGSIVPPVMAAEAEAPQMRASLRPKSRPAGPVKIMQTSAKSGAASKKKPEQSTSVKGSVCGIAGIKGESIAPIKAKLKGCGLPDGVRVTAVSGVRLNPSITVDCPTAKALNTWMTKVVQPALETQVTELQIAAAYSCRTRNNKKGAKISEHGSGKAVDVAGFVLKNGRVLTVAANYRKSLRGVHKGACGLFATTLGPGSDGYHEDHIHLDTARGRKSAYCH